MSRIAITGITGFVGSNIASVLTSFGHDVVGLVRNHKDGLAWDQRVVDFDSVESLTAGLEGCVAVVHCAIANDFNRLVQDREYAYDSYVGMTARVARASVAAGAHLVYISTDWVMDGTQRMSLETNPGNPINLYGFLKAMGEQACRDIAPDSYAVCRIAGVMGMHRAADNPPRSQDVGFGYFVDSLVRELSSGGEFVVWGPDHVNEVTTPSLAAEIGAQIDRVISRKAVGTFHLVGDDAVTRMQLAYATCDVFGLDRSKVKVGPVPESERFSAGVPVDSSLSNVATKRALGLGPTPLVALLEAFKLERETGVSQTLTKPE
jgi:dTDP-4-dehydrorhamnose reductase